MDFDEWWNSDHERENMYVSTHARAAWDYQQQRIAELEAELKREKTALENWINDALKLEAENQRLRDPDWQTYIELTKQWLTHYPADIVDGSSGDPGPLFVVAVRNALAALLREGE